MMHGQKNIKKMKQCMFHTFMLMFFLQVRSARV